MQITKIVKKNEDGTFEATLVLSEEQTQVLVNIGLGMLVQQGLITIVEKTVEELEKEQSEGVTTQAFVAPATETIN